MCVYSGAQAEGSVVSWGILLTVHSRAQRGKPNYRSMFKVSVGITSTSILLARQVMLKSHSHEMGRHFFFLSRKILLSYTIFQGMKKWGSNPIYHMNKPSYLLGYT